MALQGTDLLIVQRNQQSYKMPASEILNIIPPAATVGDGQITIIQPGTTTQVFHVNQDNNQEIVLRNDNDNTTYTAGNGLTLSGTTFNVGAGTGITVNSDSVQITNNGVGATQLNVPGNGSSGQFLSSDGDGSFSWTTVNIPEVPEAFPAGTKMLFQQSAAPTGWTKSTSHDNKALRIVSGNASSGGSTAFTSVFASRTPSGTFSGSLSGGSVSPTTLTTSQMPSHNHQINYAWDDEDSSNRGFWDDRGERNPQFKNTTNTGGSGSHTHSIAGGSVSGSVSMDAMDFDVQYVDVIIATKN